MSWGSWGKKLPTDAIQNLIHDCVELDITTFDHADIYGDYTTESDFGKAWAQCDIPREKIQLISKCGIQYLSESRNNKVKHYNYSTAYIIWSVENSLKNLQTDYIDLLLLHRPSPLMQPEAIAEAVQILKNQGKIKNFGLSNFTTSQTQLIAERTKVDANQISFSLSTHQAMHDGSLDHMMLNRILPMAWCPLGHFFDTKDDVNTRIDLALESMTEKYGATKDQLLLAWIMKHPAGILPVVGNTKKERLLAAVKATKLDLDLEDWFILLVASQGHKVP